MIPRSILFKEYGRSFRELRDAMKLVDWLAMQHGCLYGRTGNPKLWKFKRDTAKEGE